MKYNNSKCRILHLGKNNPLDHYKLGVNQPAGKQFCAEGPGDPTEQQEVCEPAVFPCGQEGQQNALGRALPAGLPFTQP